MALRGWAMGAVLLSVAAAAPTRAAPTVRPQLDYEFYKARVEPIFLKKKTGHVRCVVCHSDNNSAFKLESLPADGKGWSDEQSHKNFDMVVKLVNPPLFWIWTVELKPDALKRKLPVRLEVPEVPVTAPT